MGKLHGHLAKLYGYELCDDLACQLYLSKLVQLIEAKNEISGII